MHARCYPCAAVKICAPIVDPNLDFYMLTPVNLKSRSNRFVHPCQVHIRRKFCDRRSVTCKNSASVFFYDDLKPNVVGQGGPFLVCDLQVSLVGLCVLDYKSLCAAVTICAPPS